MGRGTCLEQLVCRPRTNSPVRLAGCQGRVKTQGHVKVCAALLLVAAGHATQFNWVGGGIGLNPLVTPHHCLVLLFHFCSVGSWVGESLAEPSSSHFLSLHRNQLFHDFLPLNLCQCAKLSVRPSLDHPVTNCIPSLLLSLLFPALVPCASYDHPTFLKSNLLIASLLSREYKVQEGRDVHLQSCNPITWPITQFF